LKSLGLQHDFYGPIFTDGRQTTQDMRQLN